MLASLLARYHLAGRQEADCRAAWLAAIEQLRADWASGTHPEIGRLPEYLRELPKDQRFEALQDLIADHLCLTWRTGQGPRLESYLAELSGEFAGLGSPASVPADLVDDEFLARHQLPHGDAPSLEEYQARFPARPDVMELLESRCLEGGRYVKLHKRGLGAMGEVWEAYDRRLRRLVAIKKPWADLKNNAEALRYFDHEARITASLGHPGIISVHDYSQPDDPSPYYVMELINSQTLSERIRDYHQPTIARTQAEERLLWNQILQILLSITNAVSCAHAGGVLHRDLKPGNVLVGEFGEVVIIDWGMAARFPSDGASVAGAVAGTPDYMPPEQADGRADVRSDVFGLGAILFEILTSRSPHGWTDGARPADWLSLVRHAEFQPPRHWNAQTPPALDAICRKALARETGQRYPTVAALARDIRCYLAGEPVSAQREPAVFKAWRWLRGRR